MQETLIAYLEKVFSEYMEYKSFILELIKSREKENQKMLETITDSSTDEEIIDLFYKNNEKFHLHQLDFANQHQRLFYTVEAYKNSIEIPPEIKEELKEKKFIQSFAVKNGKEEVVDQQAIQFTKEQIKKEFDKSREQFLKTYLRYES